MSTQEIWVASDGTRQSVAGLLVPVRCTYCGTVYDLCDGEPIARYVDCTVYTTPCCNRQADDREWVSLPSFVRLSRQERRPSRDTQKGSPGDGS